MAPTCGYHTPAPWATDSSNLRCKGEEGIGRAFYCAMRGRQIVILHSFIKKTQETPDRELKTARKRLKEIKHDN
jgi:phage-related protein